MFCEYVKRMMPNVKNIVDKMRKDTEGYYPDILKVSSDVLNEIYKEYMLKEAPNYTNLTFVDYFGYKNVGRSAIKIIQDAWENEPEFFKIDKRKIESFTQLENLTPVISKVYIMKYHQKLMQKLQASPYQWI